jgi:uncharacterized phage-associated protein
LDINFSYDKNVATQVAAKVVSQLGKEVTPITLLGMLYLIDRQSLVDTGDTLIGGSLYSFPFGPCSLDLYKRVYGSYPKDSYWDDSFTINYKKALLFTISLNKSPGDSELSDYICDITAKIVSKHQHNLLNSLQRLPEWDKPKIEITPIMYEDILKYSGYSSQDIQDCVNRADAIKSIANLLKEVNL